VSFVFIILEVWGGKFLFIAFLLIQLLRGTNSSMFILTSRFTD